MISVLSKILPLRPLMQKIMKPLADLMPLLSQPAKIFITTHHKPDGDAIGSTLGLQHYLQQKGHTVTTIIPSELPDFLTWMPGSETLINFEAHPKESLLALQGADFIFGLDFNVFSRTKHLTDHLADATQPKVLIDHHMFPSEDWDYGISMPDKSSTCEMVYDFIVENGDKDNISNEVAQCLYTGLMTDTGSFRFPATKASTHEMVAQLIHLGLNHSPIHEAVNSSWSANRIKFLGYVLLEKMEIIPACNAGLITISRADLKRFQLNIGDTEGLVNYPLSIGTVKFATLITEHKDMVKMSFRSKGDFDVNSFARTYFNGGGHFNASGGKSDSDLQTTIANFKEKLTLLHP